MTLADIEIKATMNEYRPCVVFYEGKEHKALFHQWVVKEELLIKFKTNQRYDVMEKMAEAIRENLISQTPNEQVTKVRTLLALVELEDGTMREVPPGSVKFLDSKGRFEGYSWEQEETKPEVERKCKTCKYRDTLIFLEPCSSCGWESSSVGKYPKWEEKE